MVVRVEGKQRNFLEEATILKIVGTEHVNYEEAEWRLAAIEKKPAPRAVPRPVRWIGSEEE
jgi:hypothetical protein